MAESLPAGAALGLMLAACALLTGGMIVAGRLLGSRSPSPPTAEKLEPFECGAETVAPPPTQFSVKYYLVAILFLLFDVEIVFFYAWAAAFEELGIAGFLAMLFFGGLLAVGLAYEWRSGALEWD
jgi:NADH-quinone oxidoreductase subunit A